MSGFRVLLMVAWLVAAPAYAEGLHLQDVVDVDRLLLSNGEEVQLAGISPPAEAALREKGVQFLEGLIKGKMLEVVPVDAGAPGQVFIWFEIFPDSAALALAPSDLPRFYVTRKRAVPDGEATYVFLNATMVNAGYARVVPIPSHSDVTEQLQRHYDEFHRDSPDMCTPEEGYESP